MKLKLKGPKPIKVKKVSIYRDGGTILYVDQNNNSYYQDGRIGSRDTKGKIYNEYPGSSQITLKELNVVLEEVENF
jgi:hypothetical protein